MCVVETPGPWLQQVADGLNQRGHSRRLVDQIAGNDDVEGRELSLIKTETEETEERAVSRMWKRLQIDRKEQQTKEETTREVRGISLFEREKEWVAISPFPVVRCPTGPHLVVVVSWPGGRITQVEVQDLCRDVFSPSVLGGKGETV